MGRAVPAPLAIPSTVLLDVLSRRLDERLGVFEGAPDSAVNRAARNAVQIVADCVETDVETQGNSWKLDTSNATRSAARDSASAGASCWRGKEEAVKLIKVDIFDGKGEIEIVVSDYIAAIRLKKFFGWVKNVAIESVEHYETKGGKGGQENE